MTAEPALQSTAPEAVYIVGQRVLVGEDIGTVRYVGPVEGATGDWLGIEWDDPARGRHDGSRQGTRYFQLTGAGPGPNGTPHPTGGSFVRPAKANAGVDFVTAVTRRYILDNALDAVSHLQHTDADGMVVEVWGTPVDQTDRHTKQLLRQRHVGLYDQPVNGPGERIAEVRDVCPAVAEVTLVRTLLSTWADVARICSHLPRLQILNISQNRLAMPATAEDTALCANAFEAINNLIVVKMFFTWETLASVLRWYCALEKLVAAYNDIERLSLDGGLLDRLTYLDISFNAVGDFANIRCLSRLAHLEILHIASCGIVRIDFPESAGTEDDDAVLFPVLSCLNINNNLIDNWASVTVLGALPALTELMIADNPVYGRYDGIDRQMVIARMPGLRMLNFQPIVLKERRGAEIDYVKKFGLAWLDSRDDAAEVVTSPKQAAFDAEHPQFARLVRTYGAPERGEFVQKSRALKSSLVEVVMVNSSSGGDIVAGGRVVKKIPLQMTVGHLRALVRRTFKLPQSRQLEMFYKSPLYPDEKYMLDADTREIIYYDLSDGDTVYIE